MAIPPQKPENKEKIEGTWSKNYAVNVAHGSPQNYGTPIAIRASFHAMPSEVDPDPLWHVALDVGVGVTPTALMYDQEARDYHKALVAAGFGRDI